MVYRLQALFYISIIPYYRHSSTLPLIMENNYQHIIDKLFEGKITGNNDNFQ